MTARIEARPHGRDLGAVFLGGAIGATARVAVADRFPVAADAFPWTTFAANVVGAFLLALVLTVLIRRAVRDRRIQLVLGTGVLGAFTTYSTFAVELTHLLRDGGALTAVAYAAASLLLGLFAAFGGLFLGRRLTPPAGNVEVAR